MLKEFKKTADESYWEELWDSVDLEKELQYNFHSPLLKIFKKHLPKRGVIIEGGCGNGQWVEVLRLQGYDVLGLDYAKNTVKKIKGMFPQSKFVVGDLTKLKYGDESFSGHISRGVIEHFEEGPKIINAEIHRTLEKKGILIITTPHYNPLKKLIYGLSGNKKGKGAFYQYHLTKKELHNYFKKDYVLKKTYYINPFKTIRGELFPGIGKSTSHTSQKARATKKKSKAYSSKIKVKKLSLRQKLLIAIESNQLFSFMFGHSICLILVKK